MHKDDIVGGIGAVGSTIAIFLGYLWNIGLIQLVFSFLAGSFSTYLIQNRLQVQAEKRKIARDHEVLMIDRIYGPLYEIVNSVLNKLKESPDLTRNLVGEQSPTDSIEDVMDTYLFLLTEKQLKEITCKIHDDLLEYAKALSKADDAIFDVTQAPIKQTFPTITSVHPSQIVFYLRDHRTVVKHTSLRDAVLEKVDPFSILREEGTKLENPNIESFIPNAEREWEDVDKMERVVAKIEHKAWSEKRLTDYEQKRFELMSDLTKILPELKKKVES